MSVAWETVLSRLTARLGPKEVNKWIRPLRPVAITSNALRLQAPNRFFIDCIAEHHLAALRESVRAVLGMRQILFEVSKSAQGELFPLKPTARPGPGRGQPVFGTLLPKHTFANFVVGANNQFAHAAARAVAKQPGDQYNPLFIYGGVGLGKTHLVNATAHLILDNNPDAQIAYLSAETFVNELISALRRDRMEQFKNRFRQLDLLALEDVQFLAGRERTQEEFFHTFNSLHETRRQIILTSDTFPKDIGGLAERLRNRFEWGLIADIQPPDIETRIAIIGKKAEIEGVLLPHEVAAFLATHIDSNVRELEGSLMRLGAYASLKKAAITVDLAKEVLHNFLTRTQHTVTVEAIQDAICDNFSIRPADLSSKRRTQHVAVPRQLAMYLCRKLLHTSFPQIGAFFGGRDHSTVIHAIAVTERRIKEDPAFQATVERVERSIESSSQWRKEPGGQNQPSNRRHSE
jgi:chromosomal replication initiator protein